MPSLRGRHELDMSSKQKEAQPLDWRGLGRQAKPRGCVSSWTLRELTVGSQCDLEAGGTSSARVS